MTSSEFSNLVHELSRLPRETEWVEFKHNKYDPSEIGKNISALSNAGAMLGKPCTYIIWGIDDKSHKIVGTTFQPLMTKIGNEELENWLLRNLAPRIYLRIHIDNVEGLDMVVCLQQE